MIQAQLPNIMRIALGVAYDGTQYHGWQRQDNNLSTVQACLEAALSQVANVPIQVVCAGRTDKGVHGLAQVIHFDTTVIRPTRAWLLGTNAYLPPSIRVNWMQPVALDFHARFSALARSYRYIIYNNSIRSAIFANTSTWVIKNLHVAAMQTAAEYLIGEHDFSSFRAAACQAKSAIRTVHYLKLARHGQFITLHIKANAFLQHMVRNIAGVLIAIGTGEQVPAWAQQVLQIRQRERGGVTAPSHGLFFEKAYYPAPYEFPESTENLNFF